MGDQPFWGNLIYQRGVGPAPIPQKKLTALKLVDAIRKATQDSTMIWKATELGDKIRSEDGIGHAIEVITTTLKQTVKARG